MLDGTLPAELQPTVRAGPRAGKTKRLCLNLYERDTETLGALLSDIAIDIGKLQVVHHVDREVIQQSSTQVDGPLLTFATITVRFVKRIARAEAERLILMVISQR